MNAPGFGQRRPVFGIAHLSSRNSKPALEPTEIGEVRTEFAVAVVCFVADEHDVTHATRRTTAAPYRRRR
jgi:hypothetical protein